MVRIKRIARFRSVKVNGIGIGDQIIKANERAIVGAIKNKVCEDSEGRTGSLINSLMPSATG